jgi:hypothetical protein
MIQYSSKKMLIRKIKPASLVLNTLTLMMIPRKKKRRERKIHGILKMICFTPID